MLAVLSNEDKYELNHIKEAEELGISYANEFQFDEIAQAEKYISTVQGKNKGLSGVVFSMLDGRNEKAEEVAWNIIEPNADRVMTTSDA